MFQTWYPINFLRNVALNHTKTDYVLLLDADFLPSFGLREYLLDLIPKRGFLKKEVGNHNECVKIK